MATSSSPDTRLDQWDWRGTPRTSHRLTLELPARPAGESSAMLCRAQPQQADRVEADLIPACPLSACRQSLDPRAVYGPLSRCHRPAVAAVQSWARRGVPHPRGSRGRRRASARPHASRPTSGIPEESVHTPRSRDPARGGSARSHCRIARQARRSIAARRRGRSCRSPGSRGS